MRAARQLDYGTGNTFVSSVLERVSFASIDFQADRMEKGRGLRHQHTAVDTKVWAIPSSNCAARFVLAE